MNLKEIMELQKEFDRNHVNKFDWDVAISNENLEALKFLLIALFGEIGELANIVKKVIRGDFPVYIKREEIEEEVTDIFIYLIKICYQMNIDIENNFLKKIEKNKKKFKNFEKNNRKIQ